MMNRILPIITTLILLTISFASSAQADVEMADVMRSNGKIYVVVAVLVIIFLALVVYLISLDKKATRIEKELKQNNS